MKKNLLISSAVLSIILIIFLAWMFLFRDKGAPAGEAVRDLLPFGSGEGFNAPGFFSEEDGEVAPGMNDQGIPVADLFRITDTPVAGIGVFTRGGQSVVRYVERATGHINEVILPSEALTALSRRKITNTTIPKVYEAHFSADGSSVLLRFLRADTDVVENRSLTLTPPPSTSTLASTSSPQATDELYSISAANLRGDITDVAVGSGNTLFYALKDSGAIATSQFNGSSLRTIFTSTFTNWSLRTINNSLVIQTKASAGAPGYAYTLNTVNGALAKILGPLNGLVVTPNNSGNRILYSHSGNENTILLAQNERGEIISELTPATIASKCVWSTNNTNLVICGVPTNLIGQLPDSWYAGSTHFTDNIWLFNTNTQIANVLVEPKSSINMDIDIIKPTLSSNEDYLLFINKTDLSLWAFKLPEF